MKAAFENVEEVNDTGFQIMFVTMKENSQLHWHRTMEILYILNGSATLHMDGESYELNPLDFIVIDAQKVHDVIYTPPQTMGICIHISKTFMRKYIPDIELLHFACYEEQSQQKESYQRLSECLKELTLLYMSQKATYPLESNAYVFHILAVLVEAYSEPITKTMSVANMRDFQRLEEICEYTKQHYREPVTLHQLSTRFAMNKEYFCRFFKKNMGTSYMTYVNQVRLNHIYKDLIYTQDGILEIMERHGFANQKVFYRMFKETYHCSPSQLRKVSRNNPYL